VEVPGMEVLDAELPGVELLDAELLDGPPRLF